MRVLITGGTGFIGRHFIEHLRSTGDHSIVAFGRRPTNVSGCEDIVVPEFDAPVLEHALSRHSIDVVVHLAAAGVDPRERGMETLTNVNTMLSAFLVDAAARASVRAIVIAGTCAEYRGASTEALRETAPLEDRKLYGATKAAGGILALAHGFALDIPVAVVRIFNVYGPNEAPHRLLPTLVRHLSARTPVPLSEGSQVRDFVHVNDVCRGLWDVASHLVDRSMRSGTYNLATGVGTTVATFARQVARCMNADERLLRFGAVPMRPDEVPCIVGDASALHVACGWRPLLTLADGIALSVTTSLT